MEASWTICNMIIYHRYNAIPGCTSVLIPVSVLFLSSVLTGLNSPRFLGMNSGSISSASNGGFDCVDVGVVVFVFHDHDESRLVKGGGDDVER